MRAITDLKLKYSRLNIAEKLIAINVVVFIFVFVLRTVGFLMQAPQTPLLEWFAFPKDVDEFIFKPWTLITYAFFHSGLWHILGNMLILFYASQYFLNYFSAKRLLNYYFLGAICGALVFMLSYNIFPAFQGQGRSTLIGASAAVMAVLVGIATHIPHMRIRLMFLGSIKFWWIAAFLVVIDVIQIPLNNPGGHLAHLGGALLGYIYTKQLAKGHDIGSGFEKLADWVSGLFSKTPREKKSPLKTVHKTKRSKVTTAKKHKKDDQQKKVDAILDKISKSGYDSLTKAEKDFLFNAGKDNI